MLCYDITNYQSFQHLEAAGEWFYWGFLAADNHYNPIRSMIQFSNIHIHIYAVYNGVSPDLCVHWIPREISELNQVFKDLSCFVIWLGRLATNMVVTCNLKRKIVDYYMKILVNIASASLCFPTIWMWSFRLWLCLLNDYRTFSWNCPLTSGRVMVNDSVGLDICRSGGYFT